MFYLSVFVIFFVAIAGYLITNGLYKKSNSFREDYEMVGRFKNVPYDIEVANFGSGPALYGLNYNGYSFSGFNFANAPQSFFYDYKIYQHYKKHLKKNCIIIIIICPLGFAKNKAYGKRGYEGRYYDVLYPYEVTGGSVLEGGLFKFFRLRHLYQLYHLVCEKTRTKKKHVQDYLTKEQMDFSIENMYRGWIKNADLSNLRDEEQGEMQEEYFCAKRKVLKEFIETIKSDGFRPYIVIPPVYPELYKYISPQFKKVFVMDNIAKMNLDTVPVYDLSDDDRFTDRQLYKNCMFLNQKGSKIMTQIVCERIFNHE